MSASWILLAALTLIGLFAASRAWPVRATQGLRLEGEQEDDKLPEISASVLKDNVDVRTQEVEAVGRIGY